MNIQGFQSLTLLDFPGKVACTVFCGGCNLRCPFCHNASLVLFPREAENKEAEVLEYLAKRKGILEGVCITGGEALLQPDLGEFIAKVKQMGFAVKLDTNGSDPKKLANILAEQKPDYIAMDIKSAPETYFLATGKEMDFELFSKSVELIQNSGIPYEFRTTFVKGIHTKSDAEGIGKFLAGSSPYFLQNFVDSGNLIGSGYESFSDEEMGELLSILKKYLPQAQIRGRAE